MMESPNDLEQQLTAIIDPVIQDIIASLQQNENPLEFPTADTVDLTTEELEAYVARCSNAYGRAARFAGMARAQAKLSRGNYERKFKKSRRGGNEHEREANAMEACTEEHKQATLADAVAEMAESLENGARVASESSRKLLDASRNMWKASQREAHGNSRESDYFRS